jgi:hypothetical protein
MLWWQNNTKFYPLSIYAFFNAKTLDYHVDNQAFVGLDAPQYFKRFKPKPPCFSPQFPYLEQDLRPKRQCRRLFYGLKQRVSRRRNKKYR